MRRSPFFLIGVLVLCFSLGWYPFSLLLAASDSDVVISECMKRTGMSESLCIGMIKNYMTVDRCQDYTKLSATECEKKIAGLKNDPKFQDNPPSSSQEPHNIPSPDTNNVSRPTPALPSASVGYQDQILVVKQEKAQYLQSIDDTTQAVLNYLGKNGKDTHQLSEKLTEFEKKQQVIFDAYDQYQSLVETSTADQAALTQARQRIQATQREVGEHYRINIFLPLQTLITSL